MSLRRVLLFIPLALLVLTAAAWFWLLHTQPGARWIWSRVESATDGSLRAQDISGDLSSGIIGSEVAFSSDRVNVSIAEASLAVDIGVLPLTITVRPASVSDLLIDLTAERASDDDSNLHETLAMLQLPVELIFTSVELDGGAIVGIDDGSGLILDSVSLSGRWKDEMSIEHFDIQAPLINATGSGRLLLYDNNDLLLDADLVAKPDLTGFDENLTITATLRGPLDDLALQARADEPRAFLRGRVAGITDAVRWDLQLEMPALDLPSNVGAPELPPLVVTANGRGDLQSFVAEAVVGFAGTDMEVAVAAEVDLATATVSSDLDWQNARWPLDDTEPRVESRSGRMALSGSLDDWTIAGSVNLLVPGLPPGSFTIDGEGSLDRTSIEILDSNVLGGTMAGRADYSWRQPQPFAAELTLSGIQTAAVLPEWPAVLSGALSVNGQLRPLQLSATLTDITGDFRDRTLRADGRVDVRDGTVSIDGLRLQHGATSVRADGELYAAGGLYYEFTIDDIGHYVNNAFGAIKASGALSLKSDKQFLRIDALSEEIGWGDLRIKNLTIVDHGSGMDIFDAEITADAAMIGNVHAGQLHARTRIGRTSQSVEFDVVSAGLRTGVSVAGVLDSWEQPSSWTGQFTRFQMDHEVFAAALKESVNVSVLTHGADIERFCLVADSNVSLCAGGSWHVDTGFDLTAQLSSIPVNLINAFVDTRLDFDQVVSGDFSWRAGPDGASTGRADIAMTPGTIISKEDPDLQIESGLTTLGFNLDDDSLRGGFLKAPFPGLGQIDAAFEILDVADDGAADINGSIDVDMADIELLVALFPVVDDAGGSLRGDIRIDGTVDEPLVRGDFALDKGALSYLPIGLRLDDVELRGELQDNGEIELSGSFRAGDGRARIRTRADHARTASTGLELTLRGENLTIIDVPDIRAVANTDIQVNFDGETLDLNGSIEIPRARIRPANIGIGGVYESEDVIIVAGELQDNPADDGEDVDMNFIGSVEVSLGDDVVVDLDVAETQVTGSTVFTWSGDPMPLANGRYDVGGEVLVFGQRLEITEGSVRFAGGPADNPYLRIRAEREIFGNTEVRQAGVLVAGAMSRPTIEAYTTPVTTEERALTLLVTGSDFDYEKGVGAIDFGTYIAPRVYASYGIGLFDDENVIRVRYDLQRGFGITTTSGQKESGVDLSYRIEN